MEMTKHEYELERSMELEASCAMEKLSKVVHPAYVSLFADLLWWGYDERDQAAIDLANKLNIYETEIFALANNQNKYLQALQESQY